MDAQVSMPLAPLDKKNSDIEQQQHNKKNINTGEMLIFEKENGTNGLGIVTHDEDEDGLHDYNGEHSDSSEEINNSSSDLKPDESNGSISSIIEPTDCMLSKVGNSEEMDGHFHEGESENCETNEHKEPKKDNEGEDEDLPTSQINPLVENEDIKIEDVKNEDVKNENITNEDVKIEEVKDEESVQKISVKISESEQESCRGIDGSINLKKEVILNSKDNSPDPSSKKMGNVKVDLKPKPTLENLSPLARLLHDIGLEMVRQQVYKGLIGIQLAKDAENKLTDTEKGQLVKLEEAHSKLQSKNAAYTLRSNKKCRCRTFSSTSRHPLVLHQEYGFVKKSMHGCCCCEEYKTRWPSHFILHMKDVHSKIGRLRKKMSPFRCVYCPYEGKNQVKMDAHLNACTKRFILSCNLQPLPSDCDIPLMSKRKPAALLPKPVAQPARTQQLMPQSIIAGSSFSASPQFSRPQMITSSPKQPMFVHSSPNASLLESMAEVFSRNGLDAKALLSATKLVAAANGSHATSSGQQKSTSTVTMKPKLQGENCELCGFAVYSREILWNHLKVAHKVELNKASMLAQDPVVCCDLCPSKFWTYQGLVRHSLLVHKRSMTPSSQMSGFVALCHLCGESQTTNPLSHLSSRHNITLLDMYQARQCCICNKTMRTGQAFQAHMVLYHHDIFANKDVLHTVLQALSAARYLKREESLQHTSKSPKHPMPGQSVDGRKHQMPGQSMDGRKHPMPDQSADGRKHPMPGQSMDGRKHPMPGQSMDGRKHPMPGQSMDGRKHPMPGQSVDGRKHPMPGQSMDGRKHPMPGQSMDGRKHPMPGQSMDGRKHQMPGQSIDGKKNPMPGQSVDGRKHPTSGQSVDGKKVVHTRRPSVPAPETVSPPEPVVEKKSAEEDKRELDKLYEDLANIGRPILRSMRQKTPPSSSKRSSGEKKRKNSNSKDNDSEEPPAKKTCVDKLDFGNASVSASENNAVEEIADVHLNEEVTAD